MLCVYTAFPLHAVIRVFEQTKAIDLRTILKVSDAPATSMEAVSGIIKGLVRLVWLSACSLSANRPILPPLLRNIHPRIDLNAITGLKRPHLDIQLVTSIGPELFPILRALFHQRASSLDRKFQHWSTTDFLAKSDPLRMEARSRIVHDSECEQQGREGGTGLK
jgi:hypothetical protein